MPKVPELKFGFQKGYHPDGGPFFNQPSFYRDGLNISQDQTGLIKNRRGIELLNETFKTTVSFDSDAANLFLASHFFAEVTKNDGTLLKCIFWRSGTVVRVYANDGITYTSSLENLDIRNADFTFNLPDVSNQAIYYKTTWESDGNTIIMTNHRSPIFKLVWGDKSTGNETFSLFKVQIAETNEEIFNLTAAKTRTRATKGWYSVDVPLKTGTTTYIIDEYFGQGVPGFVPTVFKYNLDGLSSQLTTSFSFSESISAINLVTLTLTYSAAITGETLRVYLGRTVLTEQNAALDRDQLLISNKDKDFSADETFAPSRVAMGAGRVWFTGVDGALDATAASVYAGLGQKFRKVWISRLFPTTLPKEEVSTLRANTLRGPFDADDNLVVVTDGGTVEPDNASKIVDIAVDGTNTYIAAKNGVWVLSGPDNVFSLTETRIDKLVDDTISSREPLAATESGLFIFGDNEVYWANPKRNPGENLTEFSPSVVKLIDDRIGSFYRSIPLAARRQSFARYDKVNKHVYFFYPDITTNNKFDVSGAAQKYLIFDITNKAWIAPADITEGVWSIFDMTTVPSDSYFQAGDERLALFPTVNLVLLGRKLGNFTEFTFGILEGKPYCADYYSTDFKAAFNSYVETFNSFGEQLGPFNKKAVFRAHIALARQEQADATDGFYEFPGACYLSKRVQFADNTFAGPLFSYTFNVAGNSWDANPKQIYFANKLGSTVVGGGQPPFEVVMAKLKIAGRGTAVRLRFGNKFGDTTLTNTIQEQEKGWGVYGYQLDLKRGS